MSDEKLITMQEARKMLSEVLQAESERNMLDYFAAHGPWNTSSVRAWIGEEELSPTVISEVVARWNYKYAQQMLRIREEINETD